MVDPPKRGVVWLAEMALGLATMGDPILAEFKATLKPFQPLVLGTKRYETFLTSGGNPWVVNQAYRLYVCTIPGGPGEGDRMGLAKFSAHKTPKGKDLLPDEIKENAEALRNEAEMLRFLRRESLILDEGLRTEGEDPVYNHSFFPEVVDSSTIPGGRYVEILAYPRVIKTLAQLAPVSRLMGRGTETPQRIDLRSAWIFGKLLKTLSFIHAKGIMNGFVAPNNVLVATQKHVPILFDWRYARKHGTLTHTQQQQEVMQAARLYTDFAGGEWSDGHLSLPHDPATMSAEHHGLFRLHFERILSGDCANALTEHKLFYEDLLDVVWPKFVNEHGHIQRPYHSFLLYPFT